MEATDSCNVKDSRNGLMERAERGRMEAMEQRRGGGATMAAAAEGTAAEGTAAVFPRSNNGGGPAEQR